MCNVPGYSVNPRSLLVEEGQKQYLRPAIKALSTLVVKSLRRLERLIRVTILGNPDSQIGPFVRNLSNMAHHALEVSVPMYRDEIRITTAITLVEEVF